MLRYLTGAAALALMAGAVSADPGGGQGKGGGGGGPGGGKDHAAHAGGQGGGNPHVAPGKAKQDRGGGQQVRDKLGEQQKARAQGPARQEQEQARADKGRGPDKTHAEKADRAKGRDESGDVRAARGRDDGRVARVDSRRRDDRGGWRWADATPRGAHGLIAGCPPGLAKKNNGCLPPGQLKNRSLFYDSPSWWNFDRRLFGDLDWNDGRYGYYDGYLVRYGDGGISGWVPLLGGALAPGNVWPSAYPSVALPPYYQDYYGLGGPDSYRYYDDTLYRVDPGTSAITAIAGLLTGNDFAVGQPMPLGYDVYNVPYSYRDRYVDGPDSYYRYSDGYIYQVDPTTQLIQAAISLLT